jgi:hypothetical protein
VQNFNKSLEKNLLVDLAAVAEFPEPLWPHIGSQLCPRPATQKVGIVADLDTVLSPALHNTYPWSPSIGLFPI